MAYVSFIPESKRALMDAKINPPVLVIKRATTDAQDLAEAERNLQGQARKAAKQDRTIADEVAALDAALALLREGTPVYRGGLPPAQRELLRGYFLLTNKPVEPHVKVGVRPGGVVVVGSF